MVISPRFLRKDTIIVKNYIGEVDGEAQYNETAVSQVHVNSSYGITLSNRGIHSEDSMLITFDLHDYKSRNEFAFPHKYENRTVKFTFRPDDFVVFDDEEFRITSVRNIHPANNAPYLIEVRCQ